MWLVVLAAVGAVLALMLLGLALLIRRDHVAPCDGVDVAAGPRPVPPGEIDLECACSPPWRRAAHR